MTKQRYYTRLGPFELKDLLAQTGLADLDAVDAYGGISISHASQLGTSQPGAITYYGGRKYAKTLDTAKASACFTSERDAPAVEAAGLLPIISQQARADFARVINALYSKNSFTPGQPLISGEADIDSTAQIMPGAVIGAGAVIGPDAIIGPNAVIYPGVIVGAGARIEANSTVQCAKIGRNSIIHSSACVGGDGFGVAASASGAVDIPHIGGVIVEDNVSIGYGTMVDRGMLGDTHIKQGAKIDNLCQIAHNCVVGENSIIAGNAGISGSVIIGNNVIMGGSVGIADHLTIGDGAVLAGGSAVMRDVPPGEKWGGAPAKLLRQYMREMSALRKLAETSKKKPAS